MAGVKGKSGGARKGAGAPPQSITLRIGDGIAIKYATHEGSTAFELGKVVEIKRGIPRTVRIELENGMRLWVLVETPHQAPANGS